jgi:cell division protein FtsB
MNLGLVDTRIIEKTYNPISLPKKYFNLNLMIFVIFLIILIFTLWYKYNQKQSRLKLQKENQDKLDEEYNELIKNIEEDNKKIEIINEKDNEYIDLDGWAS